MRLLVLAAIGFVHIALFSACALGDDARIAQEISSKLRQQKEQDKLQGFRITLKVEKGTVWISGKVADTAQRDLALDIARRVQGVKLVVNDLGIQQAEKKTARRAPAALKPDARETATSKAPREASPAAEAAKAVWNAYQKIGTAVADVSAQVPDPTLQSTSMTAPQRSNAAAAEFTQLSGNSPTPAPQAAVFTQYPVPQNALPQYALTPAQYLPTQAVGPVAVPVPTMPPSRVAMLTSGEGCQTGNCGPGTGYGGGGAGYGGAGAVYGGDVHGGSYGGGGPVPQYSGYGGHYGAAAAFGGVSYEQPSLPGYAWPSYASYPNYAALTYPRQYSPRAWPYIGPFYPYPQVPLG